MKLIVKEVSKIAFNNEKVVLENDEVTVTLNIKDQEGHGTFSKGDKVNLSLGTESKADASKIKKLEAEVKRLKDENEDIKKKLPAPGTPVEPSGVTATASTATT